MLFQSTTPATPVTVKGVNYYITQQEQLSTTAVNRFPVTAASPLYEPITSLLWQPVGLLIRRRRKSTFRTVKIHTHIHIAATATEGNEAAEATKLNVTSEARGEDHSTSVMPVFLPPCMAILTSCPLCVAILTMLSFSLCIYLTWA